MGSDFAGKRVAVLGAGKMGGILLKALLEKGLLSPQATVATVQHEERARALGQEVPVVRAMPNTPCVLGCGMTGVCKGKFADASHLETACALFSVVGKTVVVDEKHMDAVTGLSASGPAYMYIILESL